MGKPAGPDTPLNIMIPAVYYSRSALIVAKTMDTRRTDADRTFFEERAQLLDPIIAELEPLEAALMAHERGAATVAQAAVVLGDVVLDTTVRDANRTTKAELANKSGLGAQHVFGQRVDDLTDEPLHLEPAAVIHAADRLADVPDFASKARIDSELRGAATRQEEALESRGDAERAGAQLESRIAAAIVRASEALGALEGALLGRFSRQYKYCGGFFASTRARRTKRKKDEEGST